MMHLVYINPNATGTMTDDIVRVARQAVPQARMTGLTNHDGPAAIQGAEDGEAAVPGVLARVAEAEALGADAIVIACFDDTGLEEAQIAARCPVLGIGQSAYTIAKLTGGRFSVVTSLAVSVPVIEDNIERAGFGRFCASVRASGLPVLDIEKGTEAVRSTLSSAIRDTQQETECRSVILGCAGMAPLLQDLSARTHVTLIDGVTASAHLAMAVLGRSF